MKLTIREHGDDITLVVLSGRLDTTGADEIRESFAEATAVRGRSTVVDLSAVDFLASRGIGLLVANGNRLIKAGKKMVLLQPQELVEAVLVTSQLEKLLPIVRDLDQGLNVLRGGVEATVESPPPEESTVSQPAPIEPVVEAQEVTEGKIKIGIENRLSELENLNALLADFLNEHGVRGRPAYAVNLAIDELVVNVIRYAYVDEDTHVIDIEVVIEGTQIILRIVDDGRPFDPRTGPSLDLHAEEREVGGLGLILVLDMVDVLKYQRVEETNCVEVRVHLHGEDTPVNSIAEE